MKIRKSFKITLWIQIVQVALWLLSLGLFALADHAYPNGGTVYEGLCMTAAGIFMTVFLPLAPVCLAINGVCWHIDRKNGENYSTAGYGVYWSLLTYVSMTVIWLIYISAWTNLVGGA